MTHPQLASPISCGFTYDLVLRRKSDGEIVHAERVHNRVPIEGLDLIANACFGGAAFPASLFIGLYSGNHVPDGNETAANLLSLVTEVTNYSGTTRLPFVPGAVAAGGVSNQASLARFDFTGTATVNGVFISSAAGRGSDAGALVSIVRLPTPRSVDPAYFLEVLAGFQFISM